MQTIHRRVKDSSLRWGEPLVTITDPSVVSYTDTTVVPGVVYEYQIGQTFPMFSYYLEAWGYLSAGINIPPVENRGKLLLLVDASQMAALAPEIAQLEQDLAGDGWTVERANLPRETVDASVTGTEVGPARLAEVTAVKNVILNAYNADPENLKLVYILGHLPIPYSGGSGIADGHFDHLGAMPSDTFYGDLTGVWTDNEVTVVPPQAGNARNINLIGDGKFDNLRIAGKVTLGVGRVDMFNMTKFPNSSVSETDLLRRYLRKAHDYRHKKGAYAAIERRALIFPWGGDWGGYAFGGLTGIISGVGLAPENYDGPVSPGDTWFSVQQDNPSKTYLMGLGQGAGNPEGAGGVGSSADFGQKPSRVVFPSFFGSYFGNWASENNFLRAPLAGNASGDSLGLCNYWNGIPNWYSHPMAMGETLGYVAALSQANGNSADVEESGVSILNYQPSFQTFKAGAWMGLMGDPALRWYAVLPPQNLQAQTSGGSVMLNWTASTEDNVLGYIIYRGTSTAGPFTRLAETATPTYTDTTGTSGSSFVYMVRTLKLEETPGGSFQNLSQGVFATVTVDSARPLAPTGLQLSASNSTTINLSWTDNAGNETGYLVERRTDSGSFSSIATLPADASNYTDVGPLTNGTTFSYRVTALGSPGNSAASGEVYVDGRAGFFEILSPTIHGSLAAGYVDVTVRRFGGFTGATAISYATTDGSALAGTHYQAASGTLIWPDGDVAPKTVRINFLGNSPQMPRSFSFEISNPTGGASLPAQNTRTFILIEDPGAPLQSPWQEKIIGGVFDPGSTSQQNGEIGSNLMGGNWGVGWEAGRFIYQQINGDRTMVVKVEPPSSIYGSGVSMAVMVREQINDSYGRTAGIRIGDSAATGVAFYSRNDYWGQNSLLLPASSNGVTGPVWVRLTRSGNTFTGEYSVDGTSWTVLGSTTIPDMPANAYWSLFHCNSAYQYHPEQFQLARFKNISFENLTLPAPNAPTALIGAGTVGSVSLSWSHVSTFEAGFRIERRVEGTPIFEEIGTSFGKTFTDTSTASDTAYEYRVRAYNAPSQSGYSNILAAATPLDDIVQEFTTDTGQGAVAMIRNGADANTNYSSSNVLNLESASPAFAKGYLRFDLTDRPPVTWVSEAVLKLTTTAPFDPASTINIDALPDAADTWSESTITWNNAPSHNSAGSDFLGGKRIWFWYSPSVSVPGGAALAFQPNTPLFPSEQNPGYYRFWSNLSSLNTQIGSNNLLTFGISSFGPGSSAFALKEHASYAKPSLAITFRSLLPIRAGELKGTVTGPGSISLQWKDNSSPVFDGFYDYGGETGFRVEVSTNGGATYSTLAATASNTTTLNTSAVPYTGGNQMYRVVAFNNYGSATPSTPLILSPYTDMQAWLAANGLPINGTGTGSMTAILAGDGIKNLMKYALGIAPGVSGYQGHYSTGTTTVGDSDYLSLTYTRPEPAPEGVTYLPQACADLITWSGSGMVEVSSTVSGGLRTITVRDGTAMGVASRRFLRLMVTTP